VRPQPPPTLPAAVRATCDALSGLCDALEYCTPRQLIDALEGLDLEGVSGDAKLAAEWLVGVLEALAATRQ
jgi:hypothetical protein